MDVIPEKVDKINNRISPIRDEYIEKFFAEKVLDLVATLDATEQIKDADFVIVSTPTNYDVEKHYFDTSSVEACISKALGINPNTYVVVKSTIPVGFIERMWKTFGTNHIMFAPEFLRESKALYDNLHPSRIIVGCALDDEDSVKHGHAFMDMLAGEAEEQDVETILMGSKEAECVKLFANTYLAMRVAYFNEVDSFAIYNGMDARSIIKGVASDPRIGRYYNNPSFGYGGYCLPKDTKQTLANFNGVGVP